MKLKQKITWYLQVFLCSFDRNLINVMNYLCYQGKVLVHFWEKQNTVCRSEKFLETFTKNVLNGIFIQKVGWLNIIISKKMFYSFFRCQQIFSAVSYKKKLFMINPYIFCYIVLILSFNSVDIFCCFFFLMLILYSGQNIRNNIAKHERTYSLFVLKIGQITIILCMVTNWKFFF